MFFRPRHSFRFTAIILGCTFVLPAMFTRTFIPWQLLRHVYGTEPFVQYCRSRSLAFEQRPGLAMEPGDFTRWQSVLRALPEADQAKVELELAQVNEMAHADAVAQLLAAASERGLPSDLVPGETALALWFLLHYPVLFQEVFLQQEVGEISAWRTVRVPLGIATPDVSVRKEALANSLKECLSLHEGTGRFCVVDVHPLKGSFCFIAYLSDRLQLFDVFTEEGKHTTRTARPAFPILFVYYPDDGRVLLKARQRATDTVLGLFQCFGRAVLGVEIDPAALVPVFRLEVFKRKFDPPLDADDMEMVRVKALHLAYPERDGRRRVKLETLAGDGQFAILDLLNQHGGAAGVLDRLDVLYAELQVRLRSVGRSKRFLIRLWPDRCSLNQTPLGQRLYVCLKRWGIPYASPP